MITPKEAFDRYTAPEIAVDPLLKKALTYLAGRINDLETVNGRLVGRIDDLEVEVSECRSKISSESEKSSEKTPDTTESESPKPARRTASRSKR